MTQRKKKSERAGQHLIWISAEARQLLDQEAARLKVQTGGGTFSGSAIADRIIKEKLGNA